MRGPPLDLKGWLEQAHGLPLPPDAPQDSHPHWRGENAVCFGLSRPLTETSFIAAVGQALAALWGDVHKRLASIEAARECSVALPAICFQNSPEGYRLRAQTMITWSVGQPSLPNDDTASDFEITVT